MMKFVTVSEMIAIEKEADAGGHTYSTMMEHAGRGLAEVTHSAYSHLVVKKVFGIVGSGNNGGDTLVAFCYLQEWGWQTTAYIVRPRLDNDPLVNRFLLAGGTLLDFENDPGCLQLISSLENHSLVMDGILGTGIQLPLRDPISKVLDVVRKHLLGMEDPPPVIAVDCPSGIDCDNGEAAPECLTANITVTMAAVKQGMLSLPAFKHIGELRLVSIGLPEGLPAYDAIHRNVVDSDWVRQMLPERPIDGYKGTFGTALIIGGSKNYSGAVLLSGESAFRSGAGWVTLAVPEPLHAALAGQFIEATWMLLPHENGFISAGAQDVIIPNLDKPTALLIGPGIGMQDFTLDFINRLLADGHNLPPLIFDADGLKLLSQLPDWWNRVNKPGILTPHPGEMSILTGLSTTDIQANRIDIAEQFAKKWGHVIVLKGAFTVIASPDGQTAIIPVATSALARAGTGDVLAGVTVGLRAQGMKAYDAAVAAAWIHAQAGLHAADVLGSTATVLAGDVLAATVDILAEL